MTMGFASVGVGHGGSSSSFSNLSPLAPPFTLDRSVTIPFSTPLVDMTEPSCGAGVGVGFGVPLNSSLHNWQPSTSKTSGLEFFSSSTSEFDWLPFSTDSRYPRSLAMMEPSDNHGPLLGRLTMSSTDPSLYADSSDGLATSIGKAKPYYPSYASTACNKGGPMVILDQPSYNWLSNSNVAISTLDVPPCTDFSRGRGSSGSERLVEEASHSIDMLDMNKCNDFVREYPNKELLLERNLNIEKAKNLRISNMDAQSAFPGCHPKTRTPPSNPASSSQNCQFLKKVPYQEITREQDATLSVTTSIVNSPASFSITPPAVSSDSFVFDMGPRLIPAYTYDSFEVKQGSNDLSNPASSSQNCQFLKKVPYQEITREQDATLSVTTSIVNSPASFSIRPSAVSSDSFVFDMGPRLIPAYTYDSFEVKQGGNDLSNPASSSQNCQFLKKVPYQEITREQDATLSVTTSIVNSPATFSIRPPAVSSDSFVFDMGPRLIPAYTYDSFEVKQGGNNLSNLKEFLPVNSESKKFFSAETHGTCIDKNDPVITDFSSTKIHDLQNTIPSAKDSPNHTLKAEIGLRIPDASPHFSLGLKTIETTTAIESSSESFDQYNPAAVDSPCWKGAPISRISPFQAFEVVTPSCVKTVEVCNCVNLSLSQVPPSTAEDTMETSVHEPNESTIGSSLEKGATSSPKMPSVAGSYLPAAQKTSDSVKAGEFYSKMGCFHPGTGSIHEPVEDGGDSYSSYFMLQNKCKHNLTSGKWTAPTNSMEEHADARLNSENSCENGSNHLSLDAAEHVQNLPSELVEAFHGESISKIDIRILVDTLHSLSELLLAHCSNGLVALHQKDVKFLKTVMNNLDVCVNSVGSQGSLSLEQRTSQNLEQFQQLHSHFQDVGVLKSQSQMTKIVGENLECLSNDGNNLEETNQYILSVKKDREAAESIYLRNGIDSMKEDHMTKALKKVLSENFDDEEERPQTLLYKNLWLEAEAELCASNLRARFNSAKSEMEKHVSPKVGEHAKNWDELLVSDVSSGSNTIGKFASKTKVGSTSFVSIQTSSPAVSVSDTADDVITRFHILRRREDEAKHRDARNSGTRSDLNVSVKQDMVEKSALDKKQTVVPYTKRMDFSFPSSKVRGNDFGPALPSTSPSFTRTSHINDVMSRFQILKSRDEHINSLNAGKVQKITSSHCHEIEMSAPTGETLHSPGISMIHHPVADNNEVDNLDASGAARLDVLRSRGNNISLTSAGKQLQEVAQQYPASRREYWPIGENKVKGGGGLGVEMEPFLQFEAGKESRSHIEGKLPAGCSDGSSSDWEHVLWCE